MSASAGFDEARPEGRPTAQGLDGRVARLISAVTSPALLVSLFLLSAPLRSGGVIGWLHAVLACVFVTGLPWLTLVGMKRRGAVEDLHVSRREQRWPILLVALASILGGLGILAWIGAPRDLFLQVALVLAGLLITGLITLVWKVSIHCAVAAFCGVFWCGTELWQLACVAVLIAVVAWARVTLRAHTKGQCIAGAIIGVLLAYYGVQALGALGPA